MSAAQPHGAWGNPVVRAPQAALGLGAPAPKAVRMPSDPSDQDGIFEGLLWVVRGLEECGRAFTRLAGRLGKVEARLDALESAPAPAPAPAVTAPAVTAPAVVPPPAAVPPLRPDPDLVTLRRELATAQVRIARLEGNQRRPDPRAADLEEHVAALGEDVVGVYRELDGVAQRVDDRLARAVTQLTERLTAIEARLERAAAPVAARPAFEPPAPVPAPLPPASVPSELVRPARELIPEELRSRAASVLSDELDRIRVSLGALSAESPRP